MPGAVGVGPAALSCWPAEPWAPEDLSSRDNAGDRWAVTDADTHDGCERTAAGAGMEKPWVTRPRGREVAGGQEGEGGKERMKGRTEGTGSGERVGQRKEGGQSGTSEPWVAETLALHLVSLGPVPSTTRSDPRAQRLHSALSTWRPPRQGRGWGPSRLPSLMGHSVGFFRKAAELY